MIFLNKNTVNDIVVTLNEKVTLTGATFFLFEFINDDSRESLFFTGTDISENTDRFNEFLIIESGVTDVNLTASTINLDVLGFYKYNVYQQVSATNLNLSGTSGIVETGKMLLSGTSLPVTTEYTGQTNTRIVYNG